jgi:hypothetical protein
MDVSCWVGRHLEELIGALAAMATAVIIWRQASLLRQQNQLNALLSFATGMGIESITSSKIDMGAKFGR